MKENSSSLRWQISGVNAFTHKRAYMYPTNSIVYTCPFLHITIQIHQPSLASPPSSSPSSASSRSFTMCSTAGYECQSEARITAGTWLYHLPVEEGRRASKWGAISINALPDKDPSGSTERRREKGVGGGQLLTSMRGHWLCVPLPVYDPI